jgi:hypothetical protein
VRFTRSESVYSYAATTLWIAYGIAILITALAVSMALMTIIDGNASYSRDFSTIMRMTSGAKLSATITEEDAAGHDPLPARLANAMISFHDVLDKEVNERASTGREDGAQDANGAELRQRMLRKSALAEALLQVEQERRIQ